MVPHDYDLDRIVARLIERLEGARHRYAGSPARAEDAFRRIAEEHLEDTLDELGESTDGEDVRRHGDFVRHEVMGTFLPRYTRMANEMNEQEYRRFGFGVAASPVARLLTLAVCFLIVLYLARLWAWPLMLVVGSFPFWPDVAAWLYRSQYTRKLEAVLTDMSRLQSHEPADVE